MRYLSVRAMVPIPLLDTISRRLDVLYRPITVARSLPLLSPYFHDDQSSPRRHVHSENVYSNRGKGRDDSPIC